MTNIEERLSRYRDLVDDWPAFIDSCRRPLPTVVWANPLRQDALRLLGAAASDDPRSVLAGRLEEMGYTSRPVDWYPGALRVSGIAKPGKTLEFYLGLYHVQEEISLVPAPLLAARPGGRVLDMCAAPGGKTAQIACAMHNTGTLVANDVRPNRLRALRANCERLGLLNVAVSAHDGTRFPLEVGPFDRVLLDAPCSCEGNVRQTGVIPFPQGGDLKGRSGLQATLLGRAWKLLAPGGVLVYATCTFAPEENEVVLDYVLGEDAAIEPVEIDGLRAGSGVREWNGSSLRPDCQNVARFWPHHNDTGGFVAARIRKVASDR
jgi:NOL1/NOP2/sun family putative RNA methylase